MQNMFHVFRNMLRNKVWIDIPIYNGGGPLGPPVTSNSNACGETPRNMFCLRENE